MEKRTTISKSETEAGFQEFKSVAILAIGNELLSGKIRDQNVYFLAKELRALGLSLSCALFVPDSVQTIVQNLRFACEQADLVLTTGGVGPTHDDVTLEAVASAFGQTLRAEPRLERAIRAHYGERVNRDLLSMAQIPSGAELIQPAPFFLPIFRVDKVHVFPGDPGSLKLLFEPWKESLRTEPYHLLQIQLDADEGQLAPILRQLQENAPGLEVGSYPCFDRDRPYRVLVTLESKDPTLLNERAAALVARLKNSLGEAALIKVDAHTPLPTAQLIQDSCT